MSVYFIGGMTTGLVKIGKANDPRRRLADLQTGSPDDLVLLGFMDGERDEERDLHHRFHHDRRRGEWFDMSPGVAAFIESIGGAIPDGFGGRHRMASYLARVQDGATAWIDGDLSPGRLLSAVGSVGGAWCEYADDHTRKRAVQRELLAVAGMAVAWSMRLDGDPWVAAPPTDPQERRAWGDGSVYFDTHRAKWVGTLDLGPDPATGKRRRAKVSGDTRSEAADRLRVLREDRADATSAATA